MPRLVVHDSTGPRKLTEADIDAEKGDVAVCQCGLSWEYPFCDGTHRRICDEDDACFYYARSDDDLCRREVDRIVFADGTQKSFDTSAEE